MIIAPPRHTYELRAAATWPASDSITFRLRIESGGLPLPPAFNVVLRSHDDIAIEWFADFEVNSEVTEFVGSLGVDAYEPLVLEVARLHGEDFNLVCGEHFDPVFLFVSPGGESKPAEEAKRRVDELERLRAERYDKALGQGADQYAAVAIVDGCLLRRALRVPGLSLFPIAQPRLGGDVYRLFAFQRGAAPSRDQSQPPQASRMRSR